jgi:hypothetical protein
MLLRVVPPATARRTEGEVPEENPPTRVSAFFPDAVMSLSSSLAAFKTAVRWAGVSLSQNNLYKRTRRRALSLQEAGTYHTCENQVESRTHRLTERQGLRPLLQ